MGGALTRHSLSVDVSDAVELTGAKVGVSLIAPDRAVVPGTLVVALPGGGYSRGYWDIDWPGGYSQAEYHARRGWVFAAVDHLGICGSSTVDPAVMTIDLMARACTAASVELIALLRAGAFADSLDPMPISHVIGMGQSMGGCVSIVAQARYGPFDSLAVLGYSASHAVLPCPPDGVDLIDTTLLGDDAAALAWAYHHDDVDVALRQEDLKGGFPFRTEGVPPWGSATIPPSALSIMAPGMVADDAARVSVPVFIGMGDRDVCPEPSSEPRCYSAARNVTLVVVESMAHMHNFASTRRLLWSRLHRWGVGRSGQPDGDFEVE